MKAYVWAYLSIITLLAPMVASSLSASTAYASIVPEVDELIPDIPPITDGDTGPIILATPDYMLDVTNAIKNANKYVYAAFFFVEPDLTNTVITELANAKARGVNVKLVVSTHTRVDYPGATEQLSELGIPFRIATNHAKVVVIDDALLYIGSANWNKNGLENNWELTYKSGNAVAIAEAKGFINTLWSTGKATVKKTGALPEQPVNGQEYVDQVLSLLKNAKNSIKFSMYEAVYDPKNPTSAQSKLMWELKNAHQRGVDVQIILDDPRYYSKPSGPQFLSKYNIPHKLDSQTSGPLEKKHEKAFLIDDSTLVIGSHNWNSDSANSSNEYSIIVRGNADANEEFKTLFEASWNTGIWKIPPKIT